MSQRPGDTGYAAGWCIHYRRPRITAADTAGHDSCEAGIAYATFDGIKLGARPCFLTEKGESKPDALHCEHIRRPTAQEIADHEAWCDGRLELVRKVMVAIKPWRAANKGRNHRDVVECPACGGRLRLSIAAYNGHVHGRCETAGCVEWME